MQIQMGVTQKMKLYNVYRLCKKYIDFYEIIKVMEKRESNATGTNNINTYTINNWIKWKEVLDIISKIPALTIYANALIESVPDSLRDNTSPCMNMDRYNNFLSKKNIL